ncbi:MAG: sensor histidine kinase, partial [Acidobacteria bacterium]|nr:sensor histidine kinase [Acidobacteriota bacterium]
MALRAEVAKACDEGIECSLEVVGEQPSAIDQPAELTILRIAQEALANVCRHSRATKAVVQVDFGASEASLVIRDDGLGFDVAAPSGMLSPTGGGFGLTSMRERSRLARGRIQVRSTPGKGTVVEASVPYVSRAGK